MIAEFLAVLPPRAEPVDLPELAQLAASTGIAWTFALVVHERCLQ